MQSSFTSPQNHSDLFFSLQYRHGCVYYPELKASPNHNRMNGAKIALVGDRVLDNSGHHPIENETGVDIEGNQYLIVWELKDVYKAQRQVFIYNQDLDKTCFYYGVTAKELYHSMPQDWSDRWADWPESVYKIIQDKEGKIHHEISYK